MGPMILKFNPLPQNDNLISVLLMIPDFYASKLPPQHKIHIHLMISHFNVVEIVLSRMHVDLITAATPRPLGTYLEWILTESSEVSPAFHLLTIF